MFKARYAEPASRNAREKGIVETHGGEFEMRRTNGKQNKLFN